MDLLRTAVIAAASGSLSWRSGAVFCRAAGGRRRPDSLKVRIALRYPRHCGPFVRLGMVITVAAQLSLAQMAAAQDAIRVSPGWGVDNLRR